MIFLPAGIVPSLARLLQRRQTVSVLAVSDVGDRVRRRCRRRRRVVRGRARRDLRHHRAERRRQDHAVQHHRRHLSARRADASRSATTTSPASRRICWPQRGLSRTFQNLQIFFRMTAAENVMVGRHLHERRALLPHLFALPSVAAAEPRDARERPRSCSPSSASAALADQPAGTMPYGALKRLEIARALATEPKVLLLDEPAAGCNPVETAEVDAVIQKVAASGVTVVLVEHDMKLVMKISNRIHVLDQGRTLAEGTAAEVRGNPDVVRVYLGAHAVSMLRGREASPRGYGRIAVLHDVSLEVAQGEMVALVGSNGAGKTTLLRAISGVQPISGGTIVFDGKPIHALLAACARARRHRAGAGRPPGVRAALRRRQSAARRLDAQRCRHRARSRRGLRDLPGAGREARHRGRRAVGRTAADAGDRPRADGAAEAAAARRALDGARADAGRADLRRTSPR